MAKPSQRRRRSAARRSTGALPVAAKADETIHAAPPATVPTSQAGLSRGLVLAIAVTVSLRIGLALVGSIALQDQSRVALSGNWEELVLPGSDNATRVLSMWQRWDALWYQHIAEQGYAAGDGSTAFFPVYPLLMRAAGFALGGRDVLGALLVSTAAFGASMWLLFELTAREVILAHAAGGPQRRSSASATTIGSAVPYIAVLLTALFPTSFFLLAPFTESVFLALTLGAFLLSRSGRHVLAGALGTLASLTRAQGALLILPLGYEYARQRGLLPWSRTVPRRGFDAAVIGPLLPLAGTVLFAQYVSAVVGEYRSAFGVLALWGYEIVPPWDAITRSLDYIAHRLNGGSPDVEFLNLISLVGFGVLAVLAWSRLPRMYALYALVSVGLLATRQMAFSPLMSVGRYVLVIFPSFMVLGLLLAERRTAAAVSLAVSGLLLVVLFGYWVHWGFVG
jgi:hypothetical protein